MRGSGSNENGSQDTQKKTVCSSWHVTVISSNHPILVGFCAKQLCDTMVVDAACG